jgi:chromosome segregation ATPase
MSQEPPEITFSKKERQHLREICGNLTYQNKCLSSESEQLHSIIAKQNELIDTVRQKYSDFLKKISKENEELRSALEAQTATIASLQDKNIKLSSTQNYEFEVKKLHEELSSYKHRISELMKDKKDLKRDFRTLKGKLKKQKCKYKTLSKIMKEQNSLKMVPNFGYKTIEGQHDGF